MEKKTIAGYTIEESLGEGGMGVVYRAVDPTLDRRLAVKVIRRTNLSAAAKERFLREARAASRLNHPNIITVYAAGEDEGHPYLAMEYVEGRTLRSIIDEGPVPWEKATAWTCDLLDALQQLHAQGIVHRDLKPENIMVTDGGVVKLMDFGIAHIAQSETLTQEGAAVGTVYYMSPEQAAGKKADARSDIFSMGAVLYQMLTGEYPFAGEHPMAVMYSITNLPPAPLADHGMEIPERLQDVLGRAMEKDRENRFPDAAAFRDALAEIRDHELGTGVGPAGAPGIRTRLVQLALPAVIVIVIGTIVVTRLDRGGTSRPNRTAAEQLNELGQKAEATGDYEKAVEQYRRAIIADATFALPWNNLGILAWSRGNLAEADSCFREAAAVDSSFADATYNLATLRWDRGDLAGAEEYYRTALRADPTFIPAYNNLGRLMMETGRASEAAAVLDEGLSLAPQERYDALVPYLLKSRGLAAQQTGEDEAAFEYWTNALEKDSSIVELHRLLAEWYERHGRAPEARMHWQTVAGSPDEAERRRGVEALERLDSR
jgi:tetratricopeptide (TPR) repeat protein/tRNA A-37 threonylcarbamoyl transferase component Bud32